MPDNNEPILSPELVDQFGGAWFREPVDLTPFLLQPAGLPETPATAADLSLSSDAIWTVPEEPTFEFGDMTYTYDPSANPVQSDAFLRLFEPTPVRMIDHDGDVIAISTSAARECDRPDCDHYPGQGCYTQDFAPVPRLYWHDGGDQA